MLTERAVNHIKYTKESGETTIRDVIVVSSPVDNYSTIDVTGFSDVDVQSTLELVKAYKEYTDLKYSTISSFSDFAEQTQGIDCTSMKWRKFNKARVEKIG